MGTGKLKDTYCNTRIHTHPHAHTPHPLRHPVLPAETRLSSLSIRAFQKCKLTRWPIFSMECSSFCFLSATHPSRLMIWSRAENHFMFKLNVNALYWCSMLIPLPLDVIRPHPLSCKHTHIALEDKLNPFILIMMFHNNQVPSKTTHNVGLLFCYYLRLNYGGSFRDLASPGFSMNHTQSWARAL